MDNRKKYYFNIIITALLILVSTGILTNSSTAFAESKSNQAVISPESSDEIKLLKQSLLEYKIMFFKQRFTGVVLKDSALQLEIAKKLAQTPENEFGTSEIAIVREYLGSINTLNNIDPNQYLGEKMPLLVKGLFGRIDDIYQQKMEDLSERAVHLTISAILNNNSAALDALLSYMGKQTAGYSKAAMAPILTNILDAARFQVNLNSAANENTKKALKTLQDLLKEFKAQKIAEFDAKVKDKIAAMPAKKLWKLVSASILLDVSDLPSEAERVGKIDINKATAEELSKIPGMSQNIVAKIIEFREQNKVITSVQELDAIKGVGPKTIKKLKNCLYAGDFQVPEKEWTVLCFINGDNNLELASLLGVNIMERVGSTENMNVVVQIDRIARNQFAEGEDGGDSMLDGSWSTCRRYFIQKDNRPFELNSILLEKMGEVDMGAYQNFIDFCAYGVKHFPAKHYVVLISNHGSEFGIGGISFDDQSGNHMDTIQVGKSLAEIREIMKAQNGSDLIDLMVFDCCLLSKIEVLKEIADYVKCVFACENVQINWYAYDDFLRYLDKNPAAAGDELAKVYHKCYVDFMRNWARQRGQSDKMVLTASAFDLTKFKDFDEAFKRFSAVLNNFADNNIEAVNSVLTTTMPLSEVTVFDLISFVKNIKQIAANDPEMNSACDALLKSYGAPVNKVNTKEFNIAAYPETSFVLQEAHNYKEETAHGLSIGIFTKPTWLNIAKAKPEWGLNEASVAKFLEKFKAGNYTELKLSADSDWDDFMIKMINK
ncbi:MAG: clostripain-related cysteine peptidase [Candidatus Wallbacteria bacterium]